MDLRRTMKVGVVVAAAVVLLAAGHEAHAKCATPSIGVVPKDGSKLQLGAVSYVFFSRKPDKFVISVSVDGKPVPAQVIAVGSQGTTFSVRPLGNHQSYQVHAEEYQDLTEVCRWLKVGSCEPPGTLTKTSERSVTYRTSSKVSHSASKEVSIQKIVHELWHWACSRTDVYWITPSIDAAIYRVEWAASRKDYLQGRRESAVVPRNLSVFRTQFRRLGALNGGKKAPKPARIGIGAISCMGTLIPRSKAPMHVGIASIASDGSFLIPTEPTMVGPAQVNETLDRNAVTASGE